MYDLPMVAVGRGLLRLVLGLALLSVQVVAFAQSSLPTDLSTGLNAATKLFRDGKFIEAEAEMQRLITKYPTVPELHYNRGLCLIRLKQPELALPCFDEAIRLRPAYVGAFVDKGIALDNLKRWEEAVAAFKAALAIDPKSARANRELGTTLFGRELYEDALAAYQIAFELDPKSARAALGVGDCFKALRKFSDAEAAYRKTFTIDPKHAIAMKRCADVLVELKRPDDARALFQKAIATRPEYAEVHLGLGAFEYNQGNFAAAESSYRKATELDPKWIVALDYLADAIRRQDRLDEAKTLYLKVIEMNPERENAWLQLGLIAVSQNEKDRAKECLAKLEALKSSHAKTLREKIG